MESKATRIHKIDRILTEMNAQIAQRLSSHWHTKKDRKCGEKPGPEVGQPPSQTRKLTGYFSRNWRETDPNIDSDIDPITAPKYWPEFQLHVDEIEPMEYLPVPSITASLERTTCIGSINATRRQIQWIVWLKRFDSIRVINITGVDSSRMPLIGVPY